MNLVAAMLLANACAFGGVLDNAWTKRKHIKRSSDGRWLVTEFMPSVPWAGPHEWEWFSLRNLHHCGHIVDIDYTRATGLSVTVNGQPYHRHCR